MFKMRPVVCVNRAKRLFGISKRNQSNKNPILGALHTYDNSLVEQIEKECTEVCKPPRVVHKKVTIFGAGNDVGRIVSMFLKQPNAVETLTLFDWVEENNVHQLARDIRQIDTNTVVEALHGWFNMKAALTDAELVIMCSGIGCCASMSAASACGREEAQFRSNACFTRAAAIGVSKFCPAAFVAVAVPPVDYTFPMVAIALQKAGTFDPCRTIGVNTIASMRANTFACALAGGCNPAATQVPVVVGGGVDTAIPVFSADRAACYFPKIDLDHVVDLVRQADSIICQVKRGSGHAHLSKGFAIARCARSIIKGLFEAPSYIDSALVWQQNPELSYGLQICASPIVVGHCGITSYGIPTLNDNEKSLLESSVAAMKEKIRYSRYMAVGDQSIVRKEKERDLQSDVKTNCKVKI